MEVEESALAQRFASAGIPWVQGDTSVKAALATLNGTDAHVLAAFLPGRRVNLYSRSSLAADPNGMLDRIQPEKSFSTGKSIIRHRVLRFARRLNSEA